MRVRCNVLNDHPVSGVESFFVDTENFYATLDGVMKQQSSNTCYCGAVRHIVSLRDPREGSATLEDFVYEFRAFWGFPEGLFQFSRGFHGFTAFDDHLGRRRAHLTSSDRSTSVPRTGSNEGRCRRRRALSKMSFCNKVSSMVRALVQYEELQVRVLHLCTSLGSTFRTNARPRQEERLFSRSPAFEVKAAHEGVL